MMLLTMKKLIEISGLEKIYFCRNNFRSEKSLELLKSLDLDYIIGIHFPYIIPSNVLNFPK
jgi:methionyl-tRNA formyltransferase